MLNKLATRLGLILVMALTPRGAAALFAPTPQPARMPPDATAFASDDPAPTSDEMRAAIARVKASGWGARSGEAELHYGGPDGVTVTPSQLAAARADVRRIHENIDRQMRAIEMEETEADKGPPVSFKPGEPMVNPNPD